MLLSLFSVFLFNAKYLSPIRFKHVISSSIFHVDEHLFHFVPYSTISSLYTPYTIQYTLLICNIYTIISHKMNETTKEKKFTVLVLRLPFTNSFFFVLFLSIYNVHYFVFVQLKRQPNSSKSNPILCSNINKYDRIEKKLNQTLTEMIQNLQQIKGGITWKQSDDKNR